MIITIRGLEKLGLKAQRDIDKLPEFLEKGLIEGGRIAIGHAMDYQYAYKYGKATGEINHYSYQTQNYYTLALYSVATHWKFVEWGTGIYHIPDAHSAWYKSNYPFKGWHKGQKPQLMLTNAVITHINEISKAVCDTVQGGLCGA